MDKNLLKSKTFWFNTVFGVMALFPKVREFFTPELFGVMWAVLGVILRLVTKDKVILLPKTQL